MFQSAEDFTQGPFLQRTNPMAFELVNALLANLNYNMMQDVLGNSRCVDEIRHGYWIPNPEGLRDAVRTLESTYSKLEAPCYQTAKNVYVILGASPCLAPKYFKYAEFSKALPQNGLLR